MEKERKVDVLSEIQTFRTSVSSLSGDGRGGGGALLRYLFSL